MRSSPVQPGERTDELAGRRARQGGSSERGKVAVKADGLAYAGLEWGDPEVENFKSGAEQPA